MDLPSDIYYDDYTGRLILSVSDRNGNTRKVILARILSGRIMLWDRIKKREIPVPVETIQELAQKN